MPVWEFLSDPENQKTLAWLGGGACVGISGLWAAYLKLRTKPKPTPPKPQTTRAATADTGIAAAGNVTTGDVTITKDRIPRGVFVMGALGVGLVAFAVFFAGGDVNVTNGANVGGDVTDSTITIGQ